MGDAWIWPTLLGVLGAVFGSFIATAAIRWPAERSILKGRSACDSCGDTLSGFELVPVLSYAVVFGKCVRCRAVIPPSHIVIELIALGIGVAAGIVAPGLEGAAGALFGWLLLALAALDFAAFWLPNELTGTLAGAGLLAGLAGFQPDLAERVIGGIAGFLGLLFAASAYRVIRGRDGLGGGDPKMLGGIGLWLGWQMLPLVVLAASLTGLAAVLAMRIGGKAMGMQDRMPLGLLLAVAAWGVWLGERIIT